MRRCRHGSIERWEVRAMRCTGACGCEYWCGCGTGCRRWTEQRRPEVGQAVLLVVAVVVGVAVVAASTARLGARLVAHQQAQIAADAAALAGVSGGESAAAAVARADDATLVRFHRDGARVAVSVRYHDIVATAAASD